MPMTWEKAEPILRPKGVQMGVMKADPDKCTRCGLCLQNCPLRAWETDDDGVPKMKEKYECFSCYNCMAACQDDAISIIEQYHVKEGYWKTDPHPLPFKMPLEPKTADGKPDEYNTIEEAILNRRSVRNFKDDPVPDHIIRRILEAGRFAPSGGNCQPWKFVVITNKAIMKEIDQTILNVMGGFHSMYSNDNMVKSMTSFLEGPQARPGMFDPRIALGGLGALAKKELPPSLNAPCMILICADERAIGSMDMNIGICGQNMNLVANSLGVKCCWVGFVAALEMMVPLKKKLGIDTPPWHVLTSLVIGYPKFKQEGMVPREFRPVTWFREGSEGPEVEE